MVRISRVFAFVLLCLIAALWASAQAAPEPRAPASGEIPSAATATDHSRLQNLMQVAPGLLSGGEPHTDEAFAELARRGVTTVVSVDGARPDVQAARRHGLRYIHIPIGYDGLDRQAQLALVRVVRDVQGPVYVHCHHGKHRGPAAAAVACRAAGRMTEQQAMAYLTKAGTGKEYSGLWRDVAEFTPPPADAKLPELVAVAQVSSLAGAMADLDRAWDRLKLCAAAGWRTPADHADLTPAHEALLVWEALRESRRTLNTGDAKTAGIDANLREAVQMAQRLREALADGDQAAATRSLEALSTSCRTCHAAHRN